MSNSGFEAAVLAVLNDLDPAIQGNRVTVALSGGADSVALCHFLASHAEQLGIDVTAAHLNHGLRGAESDADEMFVRGFCADRGIPLSCERLPAGKDVSEAALREKRYAFLWRAAGNGFLATGHTLTDSCETLLFHLARGSRLGGLRGIPRQTGRLIRPLSSVTRADTEAYCAANDLTFVTDSTNLGDDYARNRLRHHALPAMCSVNPKAQQAMGALMREAGELYALLDEQAVQLLQRAALQQADGWQASLLAAAPDVLLRQVLVHLLTPYGDCSAQRIALAVDVVRNGGAVEWCAGVRLCCAAGRLWLQSQSSAQILESVDFCCSAAPGIYRPTTGMTVEIRVHQRGFETGASKNADKNQKINKKDLNNLLDYARISSMLFLTEQDRCAAEGEQPFGQVPVLRFRRAGDLYAPGRGRGTKSLKKWFNEIACPPAERGRLPLIAVGEKVVWLAGSGAAEGFAATEDSPVVWEVLWTIQDEEESS